MVMQESNETFVYQSGMEVMLYFDYMTVFVLYWDDHSNSTTWLHYIINYQSNRTFLAGIEELQMLTFC